MAQTTFILFYFAFFFVMPVILLGIVVTLGIQAYNDRKRDREYRKMLKRVARSG